MSILIVDDHAPARFLRKRILEDAGYSVHTADSCTAGYAAAVADDAIELVLLDLKLPDGDGWTLCERLKQDRPTRCVVITTALYNSMTARLEAFNAGADAYLADPTSSAHLLDTVANCLGTPKSVPLTRATIYTDPAGKITGVDPNGSRLLNLSARAAFGRDLFVYFNGDRPKMQVALRSAAAGQVVQGEATMRPRERRPRNVRFEVTREEEGANSIMWSLGIPGPVD